MRLSAKIGVRLPVAPGLVLDLPFSEGSGPTVYDRSGKGNHGTISAMTWSRDVKGPCGSFDGVSSSINCGEGDSLKFVSSDFSLEASGKFTGSGYIINKRRSASTSAYYLIIHTDYRARIGIGVAGTFISVSDGTILTTNTFYHLMGTFKRTGSETMYINGVRDGTPAAISTLGNLVTGYNLSIGNMLPSSYYFPGTLTKIRLYNCVLSTAEIVRRKEQPWYDYLRAA